jgi:uncharacterized protein YfiM (DUF2279 family)
VIVPLALALALQAPVTPPKDHWFGADKLRHFFVAAFTQTVTYSVLQAAKVKHEPALASASAVTAVVSVAKEVHDRRTTGLFSIRDLVWDAAGAGAATLLLARSVRTSDPKTAEQVTPLLSGDVHRSILGAPVLRLPGPAR